MQDLVSTYCSIIDPANRFCDRCKLRHLGNSDLYQCLFEYDKMTSIIIIILHVITFLVGKNDTIIWNEKKNMFTVPSSQNTNSFFLKFNPASVKRFYINDIIQIWMYLQKSTHGKTFPSFIEIHPSFCE